jgi:hypothetical protein
MPTQIQDNQLWSELSEEQQQMVAGGLQSINKNVNTFYNTNAIAFLNQAGSGPGGSFVNTGLQQAELDTASKEKFRAKFV